jgi:hypothetical protein
LSCLNRRRKKAPSQIEDLVERLFGEEVRVVPQHTVDVEDAFAGEERLSGAVRRASPKWVGRRTAGFGGAEGFGGGVIPCGDTEEATTSGSGGGAIPSSLATRAARSWILVVRVDRRGERGGLGEILLAPGLDLRPVLIHLVVHALHVVGEPLQIVVHGAHGCPGS